MLDGGRVEIEAEEPKNLTILPRIGNSITNRLNRLNLDMEGKIGPGTQKDKVVGTYS